jgi:hypothetical protein
MTLKSPSSDFIPERCQYRTATGRQCCSTTSGPNSSFCARHVASEPHDTEDLSAPLTERAWRFQNAQGINHSLGALYTLCAQGRISPRRASTLAYISSLLLRSLTAIDTDLYPKAGRPGFDLHGKPIKPVPATQSDVDTVADESQSEEPAKSQKPN